MKNWNAPNYFEGPKTTFRILTEGDEEVELLPFDNCNIGRGVRTEQELNKKQQGWKRFTARYQYNAKTRFMMMHMKVDMKTTLYVQKRGQNFFRLLKKENVVYSDRRWID